MTHTKQKCCERCNPFDGAEWSKKGKRSLCHDSSCLCHQQKYCECEKPSPDEDFFLHCNTCGLPIHQQKYCKGTKADCENIDEILGRKQNRAELVEEIVGEFEKSSYASCLSDEGGDDFAKDCSDFLRSALLRISDASMDAVEVEEKECEVEGGCYGECGCNSFNAARTASQEKRTLFVK